MDLGDVMDEIAEALGTIPGLQVIAFPGPSVKPPTALVDWPQEYNYDMTFGRGSDEVIIPVHVVVGTVWNKSTRNNLARYVDGENSVKKVLEQASYTAFHECRVLGVEFDPILYNSNEYFGATFTVSLTGSGG